MWSGARVSSGGGGGRDDDDDDDIVAASHGDAVDEDVVGLGGGRGTGPSRPDRDIASDREDDVLIIPPASPNPGRDEDDNDDIVA
jgi:hypothetical protein